ncbi:MAG: CRISPR-associated primase-polymerase type A1 [Thermodesulfobacteriota bacterium]
MENPEHFLKEIRELLAKEDIERAKDFIQNIDTKNIFDPDFHYHLALICEDLGLISRAILEYNLSLRDQPHNVAVLKRLAIIYQDQGQIDKAIRLWQQVIPLAPEDEEPIYELGLLFEQNKEWEAARHLYQSAFERTKNPKFQKFLKELDFQRRSRIAEEGRDLSPEEELLTPTDAQLIHFATLFSGREAVYARQWVSPTGNTGYTPVQEPFTMQVAKNHILGHYTVGIYQLRLDNTVNFIAFDVDIAKSAIARGITDQKVWQRQVQSAHKFACQLLDISASYELPFYLEDSGFKGRHLWLFLERPIPAKAAKRFAEGLVSHLSPPPPGVHLEIFPKQSYVSGEGLGNLIKLPLGIHRKTGRRGLFIHPDGQPVENQLAFLDNIQKVKREKIYETIQRIFGQVSGAITRNMEMETQGKEVQPPIEDSQTEIISSTAIEEYHPDQDLQLQFLLNSCEVLGFLASKVNDEKELTNDERNVLTYVIGHLDKGAEAVNHFLSQTINAHPSMFLKSRFQGNPMSCPKIRQKVPHISSKVNCNCQFDPRLNMYPTPLLHLIAFKGSATITADSVKLSAIKLQQLVKEYIKIKGEIRRLQLLAEDLEKNLIEVFKQNEVTQIPTPIGTLKMLTQGDGSTNFIVEI